MTALRPVGGLAAEIVDAAELASLRRWQTAAMMLLDEIAEHFAGEADADQPQGCDHPIPNTAMRFQTACDLLTARAHDGARETLRRRLAASVEKEGAR